MKQVLIILLLLIALPSSAGDDKDLNQDPKAKEVEAIIEKTEKCMAEGNFDESLALCLKATTLLPDVKDLDAHISVYNNLGVIYRRRNMNDSAIYYYNRAMDCAVKYGDDEWLTTLALNLCIFYHNLKHFKDAEKYLDIAVRHSAKLDDESMVFYCCQVGALIKSYAGKLQESIEYSRKAWAMANGKGGTDDMRLRCIPTMVSVFDDLGKTDSVFHYIALGNKLLTTCDNEITRIGFIQSRAEINYRHERWHDLLPDLLLLANKTSSGTLSSSLYTKIADSYFHLADYRKAYCYMDSARMFTDSLAAKDMEAKLAEFNVKYETKEKDMELTLAREQHAELRMQRTAWALVGSIVIAILIVVILVIRHRHRLRVMFIRQCAEMNEARQYIIGLEDERKRMAKELHDGIANDLLGISMKMFNVSTPEEMKSMQTDIDRLRSEVRNISHGMMPPDFSRLNLNEILNAYVSGLELGEGVKINCLYHEDNRWDGLPKSVAYEVFRIAQECISNAVKHSGADNITVSLTVEDDGATGLLCVSDNGHGMAESLSREGRGLGIIDERVKSLNGCISYDSDTQGTSIKLRFPINA